MRASLASATSLLALLVFEGRQAEAATITLSTNTATFDVLVTPSKTYSSSVQVTASITGGTGQGVTFAGATGEFGPSTTRTVSGTGTYTATATYTFQPTVAGQSVSTVGVTTSGSTSNLTLSGLGVAPVASVSGAINQYVLVQQTATFGVQVINTGNGNLAAASAGGTSSLANLLGSIGTASNSVFVGTPATFSIAGNGTPTASSSATYNYTYKPTSIGTASATVRTTLYDGVGSQNGTGTATTTLTATAVAPVQSVTPTSVSNLLRVGSSASAAITVANTGNGNLSGLGAISNLNGTAAAALGAGVTASAGNLGTFSLADSHGSGSTVTTLGYTYNPLSRGTSTSTVTVNFSNGNSNGSNLSQSVTTTITGTAVGPVYTSSVSGASTSNTPTAVANGSVGAASSTISFGTLGRGTNTLTVNLYLQNTTPDLPGSVSTLTDLTIKSFALAGANPSYFNISSFALNSVVTAGGSLLLPISVIRDDASGVLSSTLTIFTDESAGFGGTGDTFTYFLTANVPEPTTLAVLGAGLAGLASVRRRTRKRV